MRNEVTGWDFTYHLSSLRSEEGKGTQNILLGLLIRAPTCPIQGGPSGTRRILPA